MAITSVPGLGTPGLFSPGTLGSESTPPGPGSPTSSIGIVNGCAAYTGDGTLDGVYYIANAIDFSNVHLQFQVCDLEADSTNFNGAALRFRRADEDNWWEFGMSETGTGYTLRKKVAGDIYIVSRPGTTRAVGDVVRVEAYEDRINCYVNETMIVSISDTELMDNTQVGIRFSKGCVDTAIDNFIALQLVEDIRENLNQLIQYQVLVDWDQDNGLNLSEFEIEANLDAWDGTFGSREVTLERSQEFVHSGLYSAKCTYTEFNLFRFNVVGSGFSQGQFGGPGYENIPPPFKFGTASQGFDDGRFATVHDEATPDLVISQLRRSITDLIVGRDYELRIWVLVPSGSPSVGLQVQDIGSPIYSTKFNQWEELVFPYTATATSHTILLLPSDPNPNTGTYFYLDESMNLGAHEDITCHVLGLDGAIDFRLGRDQARSLASISPSEVSFNCDNSENNSQMFSPDNPGSPLYGFLEPGKPIMIRCSYNNQIRSIFHGFIDNYTLHPNPEERHVEFSCIDGLQYLGNATMSTELYPSIQSGGAIHVLLDQVNWPATKRDIDSGASTLRLWWEEDTDGLTALQKVIQSEGLPAIAYVDNFGNFIFKDRHHRLIDTKSKGIQAQFNCDLDFDEPVFSAPVQYDIGWKDIINQVDVEVENRAFVPLGEVWSSDDLIVIPAGERRSIDIKASNPFYEARIPDVGFENVLDFDADIGKDIVLKTGSGTLASVDLTRTSGQSTKLELTAGGSTVTISRIRLRALAMETQDPTKVLREDSESIDKYGVNGVSDEFPWTGINDMDSIAQIILGHRSERLPVVNIVINNGNPVRISNIMNRSLSDRIHIVEMLQTFMQDDFFIEVLQHEVTGHGSGHRMTIGCEKSREQLVVTEEEEPALPEFTFDVAGQGFNDGYFLEGGTGLSLSNNLFILNQSHLDEDGLGF